MNCKNCGAPLGEGALFCGNCGMKVEAGENYYEAPSENAQNEYHQEVHTEYQEQGSYVPPVMPEYPAEPVVPAEKPNTVLWIVLSAIHIFTCCQITGIIGLIFAILGHVAADKGDFADAAGKIRISKILFWVGFGLGLLVVAAYIVLFALGFAVGLSDYTGYYYY